MGFIGSINHKLRLFFHDRARVLDGRECFIGCSGNFTVEQILTRRCRDVRIHSNDVSLYSSALGYMLAGQPFRMEIVNEELAFANAYLRESPAHGVSVLLLLLEMLKFEKRKNPFSERMRQAYLVNFEKMLAKTLDKVRRAAGSIKIESYTMQDVYDYYPRPGGVSIGFLPTYVGGYEKLFARLEESVFWDKPPYEMLTTERREKTVSRMAQGDFILYDDRPRDMPCVARVDLFGKKTCYIYSNLDFRQGVFRKTITEKVPCYQILMPDEEIPLGAAISFEATDISTVNHYRNMYLSKKVEPGTGDPCFLAFAGEKLFGFLIFTTYSRRGSDTTGEIYLLSDFVVPSTRYRRLAKLLLMAVKCREVKQMLSERALRDYKTILTTAFTDKPVSMKYRGVFDLAKRGDGFLNYRAAFDETSLTEVLSLWMKKHAKQ